MTEFSVMTKTTFSLFVFSVRNYLTYMVPTRKHNVSTAAIDFYLRKFFMCKKVPVKMFANSHFGKCGKIIEEC